MSNSRGLRVRAVPFIAVAAWLIATATAVSVEQLSAAEAALTGISVSDANRAVAIARQDPWLAGRLATDATELVEVVDPNDGKSGVVVRFIDYAAMDPFGVVVDLAQGTLTTRLDPDSWPNYSPREFEAAAAIALDDPSVMRRADGELVVNNMTGATDRGVCLGRRCIAVFLTPPDGSYDRLIVAIVDMGKRAVVDFELTG